MPRRGREPEGREPAWSIASLREPRYSQSLERGLAILGCFTPDDPVLGIADLADRLEMSRSTTHRYVTTLVALGYLEQGPSRKYRLGLRVTDLGMSAMNATGLREHAHDYLEELRLRASSFTVGLAVLDGLEIVYVDRLRSFRRGQSMVDLDLDAGSRLPAYCTAMGKVLLAYLPESEQDERIAEMTMTKQGPNTITSKSALREELEQVREEGFAANDEEFTAELYSISVPVRDDSEVVAAVNMAAHASMISLGELVDALGPHLISTADRISARLGYRREDEVKQA
jgi:IclR family pca regulon transcriptional regulator